MPSRAPRWRMAMRWSVEAPGGTSTAAPVAPRVMSTSGAGRRVRNRASPQANAASGARSLRRFGRIAVIALVGRAAHPPVGEWAAGAGVLRQLGGRRLRHGCVLRLHPLQLAVEAVVRESDVRELRPERLVVPVDAVTERDLLAALAGGQQSPRDDAELDVDHVVGQPP